MRRKQMSPLQARTHQNVGECTQQRWQYSQPLLLRYTKRSKMWMDGIGRGAMLSRPAMPERRPTVALDGSQVVVLGHQASVRVPNSTPKRPSASHSPPATAAPASSTRLVGYWVVDDVG